MKQWEELMKPLEGNDTLLMALHEVLDFEETGVLQNGIVRTLFDRCNAEWNNPFVSPDVVCREVFRKAALKWLDLKETPHE